MRTIVMFFALLILLGAVNPLPAQAQLSGELVIDWVSGYHISMRLIVTNTGDQTFYHEFPTSELCFYSLNGLDIRQTSIPVITPFTLEPGASHTFAIEHSDPLPSGVYVVRTFLCIYDAQNNPMLLGEPQTAYIGDGEWITIGAGDQRSRVPIDLYWRTSLYECVFLSSELYYTPTYITTITFYSDFSHFPFLYQHVRVYLANVPQTDLSEGWIDPALLVLVFDGLLDFWMGTNAINITLPESFLFYGYQNLGLAVFRTIPSSYQYWAEPFCAQEADPLRSRKLYSDYMNLDPMLNPAAHPNQHIGYMPMTSFHAFAAGNSPEDTLVPSPMALTCYPNPALERCAFTLNLSGAKRAKLEIYNLRGQKVRTLESADPSTDHVLEWDRKDAEGKRCPAGVYLYRASAGKDSAKGKLALLP